MLSNSLVYIFVIAAGYALKRIGLFRPKDAVILSKLVLYITLPAAIIKGFTNVDFSFSLILVFLVSLLTNGLLLTAGAVLSRKCPPLERGLSVLNTNTFNAGNFAIPFLMGIVGPEAFAGMCMFDMASSSTTFGPNLVLAQSVMKKSDGKKTGVLGIVKRLARSPAVMAYLVMLLLCIFKLSLPSFFMNIAIMAGNANSFLAMLCIGILFDLKLPKTGVKTIVRILGSRYLICGAAAVLVWFFLPVSGEMARTTCIVLMAPIAGCATLLTVENGCDGAMSAVINSLSMVCSIAIMMTMLVLLPVR